MGGDHAERAVPAAAWTLCALPQQLTPRPTLATSSAAPPIAGVTKGSESVAVLSAAGAELLCLLGLLHSAVAGLHPGLQCCSMHRCGWLPEGPSALSSLHPPPPAGPFHVGYTPRRPPLTTQASSPNTRWTSTWRRWMQSILSTVGEGCIGRGGALALNEAKHQSRAC